MVNKIKTKKIIKNNSDKFNVIDEELAKDKIKLTHQEFIIRHYPPLKAMLYFTLPSSLLMLTYSLYSIISRFFSLNFAVDTFMNDNNVKMYWSEMFPDKSINRLIIKSYISIASQYCFVVYNLSNAFSLLLTVGSGILYSIQYGQKDHRGMSKTFGNSLFFGFIVSIIVIIFNYFLLSPTFGQILIRIQEGKNSNSIIEYMSQTYFHSFFYVIPFLFISGIFLSILRSQGKPFFCFIIVFISLLIKCFSIWFFLDILELEFESWSYSSIFSFTIIILMVLGVIYFDSKGYIFRLKWCDFKINWNSFNYILKVVLLTSIPSFTLKASAGLFSVLNSYFLTHLYKSPEISNYYVLQGLNSSLTLWIVMIFSVVSGISQGARGLLGYSFGSKKYIRIKELTKITFFIEFGWLLFADLVFFILTPQLVSLFGFRQDLSYKYRWFIRAYIWSMPCFAITITVITLFISIKHSFISLFLSIMRSFVLLLLFSILGFLLSNYLAKHYSYWEKNVGFIYLFFLSLSDFILMFFSILFLLIFVKKNIYKLKQEKNIELKKTLNQSSLDFQKNFEYENIKVKKEEEIKNIKSKK